MSTINRERPAPSSAGYGAIEAETTDVEAPPFNLNTRFAADRTYMASDRTTIAWVRTAISMIGFGVTIAKTADLLQQEGLIENARTMQLFGILFVAFAWLGLVLVIFESIQIERRLNSTGYPRVESLPLGLSMAILVLVIGILGVAVIYHPLISHPAT